MSLLENNNHLARDLSLTCCTSIPCVKFCWGWQVRDVGGEAGDSSISSMALGGLSPEIWRAHIGDKAAELPLTSRQFFLFKFQD